MPTLDEIRAGLGPAADQFTDEQLYNAAMSAFAPLYANPKVLQKQLGYDPNRDFARGGEIALRNTGAALAGAGAAVADTVGWEGGRDSMLGLAQRQQTRAQQLGRTYDDVDNFGQNPLGFLSSAAGQAIGYAVPSLVGGGVAGLGARMLGRSALAGYGLGAGASNLAQETGGIYNELAEQGIYDPGRALMYGAPAAALDTASELVPFLKGAGTGNVLRRVGTGALKQAGTEAGTEVLQTGIERAGAYKDVLSPEAWHEYRNAAALGAIGGGMFGGAMGLQRPAQPAQAKPPVSDHPLNPTDLLNPAPPQLGWNGYHQVGQGQAPFVVFPDGSAATQPDAELLQRYGMTPDTLAGIRAGGPRVDPAMDTGDLAPYLPGKMVADEAGAVALDASGADALYGREEGDPGLALARQRYLDQVRAAEEQKAKAAELQAQVEAAQARHAANRQAAVDALVDKKPDGSPVVPVRDREIATFTALRELHSAGVVDDAKYADLAGRMREAYTLDDKMRPKALNAVAKEVATLKEQANAAGAGTDGAARPADVGRGADGQRAPGQPGGVRPAGAQPAAQGVAGAGAAELGSAGGRGDGALTGDQIVERIQQLDPVEQAYVGRWLGVDLDEDGNLALREQGAESLRAMEKTLGVSYETVRERVKAALVKLGLPKGMKPKQLYEQLGLTAANTDLETLERNVDTSTPASEAGTGDLDAIVEAADEGALGGVGDTDVRVERAQTASDELVPEIPDQDPMGRQREVAGPIDEGSMDVEDRIDESRALTLDSALEGDVSAGRVTADDIAEAQFFYEQNRQRGMAPWGRMGVPQRAELVRMYARARLAGDPAVLATKKALYEDAQRTDGRGGSAADAGAARSAEGRPADGEDPAVAEGVPGDRSVGAEVPAARGPVPVVTKRKRRVVQPDRSDADVSWGNQLASAEEGGATLDRSETTKVTREQVLSQGPFAKAAESLRALGLGHMLDWVGEWRSAGDRDTDVADGWLEGYGTQYVLTLKDASALGTSANATWVMLHELGHAADLAPSGGVYSAHPDMRFEMADGRAVGRGAVAAEMAELYENDPWWSAVLQYPLDARRYGVTDGETVAGELFAQLFAMYVDPKGRAKLQLDAPLAFQFIQESVNDIQATRPLRVRTPGEVKGRAQAFARRYRGVSSGQSAGTAAGGNAGAGGRALRAARNSAADHVAALRQATQSLPQPAQNAWTDIKDFAARKMPYVMTTFQIFEQFGSKLKRLGDMIRANDLMRQESIDLQMKVDEIVKRWDKLPKAAGELLTDVATRATMLGAYPDKAWAGKENAHVPRERQAEFEELRRLYERMKSTSPEALKLYHETLDAFEAQRQQLEAATKRMFEQYGKTLPKPKRTPGPYFPLVRRGDYLAIGESPQLVALKKRLEQAQEADADEATITDLNEQIDQLEKNDQHFWVSSHEKRSGMEQAIKEYERRGLVARRSLASQRLDGLPTRNIHSTIAALTAEATKNLSKDGAKEVGNALAEILLRSLPEGHALERQAARRNISGAVQDMKRAVAVAGRQNAYYIARLNHAKEVSDALFEMGRDAKDAGDINLQHVHRELEQRHALNMRWSETPIQDAIGKAGWMWYLGASPMFLMMNAAQPWLVSAPVMAGQYGAGAASRELARATADAFAVMKNARWTGGKFDLWSGIDPDTIQSRFKSRNAKGEEIGEDRKAIRELILRGVIDEGLSPELAMYAESGGTGLLTKFSRFVGWPSQQVELVNRVATALAAFRLERGVTKAGETAEQAYQRALDKAYATVVNTHVDYGAENAPRAMREGGGIPLAKLIFQFRRYQQAMLYLLASNVKKLRDPNEQKVARATLAYLAVTSGMAGGAIGLPLAGSAMWLTDVLRDLFGDDDDEDGDTRTKLRNALRDLTGDKTTADVLAKGLPALFGFDIAERVGMGQVGQLFPRLDLSRSKTAEDKVAKGLLAVAGPGAGLAVQGMDAASFFGAGDFWRGTERLFPKMASDLMRAMREGYTGVEDRKGEQMLSSEELTVWDGIRRGLGASSMRESDRFAADRALKDVERKMGERRDRIHTEFRRALRSGDFEDVREMIDEYNADHPDAPIKPKDEAAWRKEAQRAARERDPETGLKVTRRQQPLAELQRFAQP